MTGRYHLTTIYADSSRPNTPKHAKFSPPAAGIAEIFPINFRPHASIPPGPGDRTPAHHGVRRHGRRAVLPRCNSTRRNHLIGRRPGFWCRVPNAECNAAQPWGEQRAAPIPTAQRRDRVRGNALQSIRERVFAPGRQGFRDRMQHGDDEETEPTPALAPRPRTPPAPRPTPIPTPGFDYSLRSFMS
jgi:hypothetical protein